MSPHLRLEGATLAYDDGRPVLSDLDLDLGPGWTGIVGENGAGKSTLLRALVGALPPVTGRRHCGADLVAFVEQRVDALTPDVAAFIGDWSKPALRWRARLELDEARLAEDPTAQWPTLSQGQRKRWQIAAALAARPDALVLDEPSNHLDGAARKLLLDALARFDGVGVVVSHDRALLDALTTQTAFVEAGGLTGYALAYSAARQAHTEAHGAAEAARRRARDQARRAARQAHATRREAEAAAHSRRARARMKGRRDTDATSAGAKARTAKAEAALSKRSAALRTRAEAARHAVGPGPERRAVGRNIHLEAATPQRRRLLQLEAPALCAGPRTLIRPLRLELERGDRVRLAGANGAGKSTLLRRIAKEARGRVAFVEQDPGAAATAALQAVLRALPAEARGRVLQLAAAIGADPEDLLDDRPFTPGQAQKLALCAALGRPVDLVLLDEPTNHLDLPAIERLQDALQTYEGGLVLITHDEALAEAVTEQTWCIESESLKRTR